MMREAIRLLLIAGTTGLLLLCQARDPIMVGDVECTSSCDVIAAKEVKLGINHFDHVLRFRSITALNYTTDVRPAFDNGHEVVMNLEFFDGTKVDKSIYPGAGYKPILADITRGDYDTILSNFAKDAKKYGRKIWLRTLHEMNLDGYPWSVFYTFKIDQQIRTQEFLDAWRHIYTLVKNIAGDTIVMQLGYNSKNAFDRTDAFSDFFPGENYVDMVCTSGYNRAGSDLNHQKWLTFTDIYTNWYNQMVALTPSLKPLCIGEISSAPSCCGGDKVAWFTDAWSQILNNFPRITQVSWFLYDKDLMWDAHPGDEATAWTAGYNNAHNAAAYLSAYPTSNYVSIPSSGVGFSSSRITDKTVYKPCVSPCVNVAYGSDTTGFFSDGVFLQYNFKVAQTGTYTVQYEYASNPDASAKPVSLIMYLIKGPGLLPNSLDPNNPIKACSLSSTDTTQGRHVNPALDTGSFSYYVYNAASDVTFTSTGQQTYTLCFEKVSWLSLRNIQIALKTPSPTPVPTTGDVTPTFCTPTRCQNGGSCQIGDTSCTCVNGYSGRKCETGPTAPTPAPTTEVFCTATRCKNGGSCKSGDTKCKCVNGYTGRTCKTAPPTTAPTTAPTKTPTKAPTPVPVTTPAPTPAPKTITAINYVPGSYVEVYTGTGPSNGEALQNMAPGEECAYNTALSAGTYKVYYSAAGDPNPPTGARPISFGLAIGGSCNSQVAQASIASTPKGYNDFTTDFQASTNLVVPAGGITTFKLCINAASYAQLKYIKINYSTVRYLEEEPEVEHATVEVDARGGLRGANRA